MLALESFPSMSQSLPIQVINSDVEFGSEASFRVYQSQSLPIQVINSDEIFSSDGVPTLEEGHNPFQFRS